MADRNVYFAKITREPNLWTATRTFREDLEGALDPDRPVTRYRKTWHVSRHDDLEGGTFMAGKLGFERMTARNATTWDPDRKDFVTREGTAVEGSFAIFVIDTQHEIVGFETRPPDIALTGFVGAFKKLLTDGGMRVTIELLPDPRGWTDFVQSVERVVRVRAVIHAPNPGWRQGSQNLRAIVEEANAERGEVTAIARKDGALNPDAPWIDSAIQHVAEHGQGDVKATGIKEGRKAVWSLNARLQVAVLRDSDANTVDLIREWIRDRLRRLYGED